MDKAIHKSTVSTDMKPTVMVYADGKQVYNAEVDIKSSIYSYVIKQLMEYTMSQDKSCLPLYLPMLLCLSKKMKNFIMKDIFAKKVSVEFKLNDSWSFSWKPHELDISGWYFDGKYVGGGFA